ncbi:hypothetical protein MCOR07_000351, partial [Pyricularia oryzae]
PELSLLVLVASNRQQPGLPIPSRGQSDCFWKWEIEDGGDATQLQNDATTLKIDNLLLSAPPPRPFGLTQ